jgi:hypothetical protein
LAEGEAVMIEVSHTPVPCVCLVNTLLTSGPLPLSINDPPDTHVVE